MMRPKRPPRRLQAPAKASSLRTQEPLLRSIGPMCGGVDPSLVRRTLENEDPARTMLLTKMCSALSRVSLYGAYGKLSSQETLWFYLYNVKGGPLDNEDFPVYPRLTRSYVLAFHESALAKYDFDKARALVHEHIPVSPLVQLVGSFLSSHIQLKEG